MTKKGNSLPSGLAEPTKKIKNVKTLLQIEADLEQAQLDYRRCPSTQKTEEIKDLKTRLRNYSRQIKNTVMKAERDNDRYLIFYRSTKNYYKMTENSALFYCYIICEQIHYRYNLLHDSDDYSPSDVGYIAVKSFDKLKARLADIKIFPDETLSTPEIIYFKLPDMYTGDQIKALRKRSEEESTYVLERAVPNSPVPELATAIRQLNILLYHTCKKITDNLAREAFVIPVLRDSQEIMISYLNYANARDNVSYVRPEVLETRWPKIGQVPQSVQAQNLFNLMLNAQAVSNSITYISHLNLLPKNKFDKIFDNTESVIRLASSEYRRCLEKDYRKMKNA